MFLVPSYSRPSHSQCLMLCISTGANLFAAAQSRGASVRTLMSMTLTLSFGSMCLPFLVPYPPSFTLVLMAFCGFEAACGAFMPVSQEGETHDEALDSV